MATGYTAKLHDGEQSTQDFILGCSLAMGAAIHQRDEDGATKPHHDTPSSSYYESSLESAKKELIRLQAMTDEQAQEECQKNYAEDIERWHVENTRRREIHKRYNAMLANVRAWKPPTKEHVGLKEFMIQQLIDSVDWDCRAPHLKDGPVLKPWEQWRTEQIEHVKHNLVYYPE